ncbi:MAG: hypothetical protein JJE04_09340 [Acidobacteriia bacterium]|nr:hypothetical protein [Terriglobia bacterium]
MTRERTLAAAAWALPWLVCLAVYWPGLLAWFQQDDFAWLGLTMEIHSQQDFWRALFEPRAQGTIRPWSERAYFMGMYTLFGLDALPFRALVFATQLLNLFLLARFVQRLTGSLLTAGCAGLFWTVNPSLGGPMSWSSSYNQVMCTAFLLGALVLFQRYLETGRGGYYWAQMAVFVLGFGALEINIVYPAVAALVALVSKPRKAWATLPMFGISGVYFLLHSAMAAKPTTGPYARHYDASMLSTLWHYVYQSFGFNNLAELNLPPWLTQAASAMPYVLGAALLGFTFLMVWRRQWIALLPAGWFLCLIGPVLPLKDHLTDYYLVMPSIGLGLWMALAFHWGWRRGIWMRALVMAMAVTYVGAAATSGRTVARYNYDRSERARQLVMGVARARELHPGKTILLQGVGTELFWAAVNDQPFRLNGSNDVHLTPGSEEHIEAHPELGDVTAFVFPSGATLRALQGNKAVVYTLDQGRLRNITRSYRAVAATQLKDELARRIDAGHPAYAGQLGAGWEPITERYRWMGKRADAFLGGPRKDGEKLYLAGFCAAILLAKGPLHLTVRVDGVAFAPSKIEKPDGAFELIYPLPAGLAGKEKIHVEMELDRTYVPPEDGRELGLVFGSLAIR